MITLLITGAVSGTFLAGCIAAIAADNKRKADAEAAEIWRNAKLRNGVTTPSPFHAPKAQINIPGLVEVHPQSRPAPCTRTLPLPLSESLPVSVENPDSTTLRSVSATPVEVKRKGLAAVEATNRETVIDLHSQGLSKTKIIKHVWGASPGGSAKYKAARTQYESIISEVMVNA